MATLSSFASLAILSLVLVIGVIISRAEAKPRAFFVFGDSLVDNGNNNYMATTTCVDAPPYGIDYPPSHRPTGCFSNGYNIPNLIRTGPLGCVPSELVKCGRNAECAPELQQAA
ncbi:GDSL esterase/lipase [Glycine soja]|nr:GDSL esterase/lipase [Glycine max]